MKIHSLTIENFMSIGGPATVMLADRGLVLIQGVNESDTSADSNGAGKSSIADALCWCLYGVTARGESGDSVVNLYSKTPSKNCVVRVRILDGDHAYDITRHRRHKTGKNSLVVEMIDPAGDVHPLTKGTEKLTQAVVDQIVGCSLDVFCGAVYAGQERMPDLPGMTDKQLKMLIEEASGATVLEAAYTEASARCNAVKRQVDAFDMGVRTAELRVTDATSRRDVAIAAKEEFEGKRIVAVRSLGQQARTLKQEIASLDAQITAEPAAADIQAAIDRCDAQIAAVAGEQQQERELHQRASTLQYDEGRATVKLEQAQKEGRAAKAYHDGLDSQIGCPCSACNRPFTAEDIAPAKEAQAAKLPEFAQTIRDAKSALAEITAAREAAEAQHRSFVAGMTDLTKVNAERAALASKLNTVQRLGADRNAKANAMQNLIAQAKEKGREPNPFAQQIDVAEALLDQCETELLAARASHEEAQGKVAVLEQVVKVFSPAGVRAFLLDEVTPFLNSQTAKYLGVLSDGNISAVWTTLVPDSKGALKEKFSIEVVNANGGNSFGLVSGGEKRKVRIACALALQDLVARRASKPIELFIGDEIDDALDPAGLERLADVLREKAAERGSVFIISHNDLKDWVPNTITVRKTGKVATIEENAA